MCPEADSFPALVEFSSAKLEASTYRPERDRILAGDPVQTATNLFSSGDEAFHCGIWTCEPGKWRVVFTETEFCQLTEGVIIVTGDDGVSRTFRAGDAFVTNEGFTGTWDVVERAKKVYAIYEP